MNRPRTMLIYGESGIGKTSQLFFLAKYFFEKYGIKSRLISADGGGYVPLEPLVEEGIVDAFDISNREHALADVRRLSDGYWPRDSKKLGEKGYFRSDDRCKTPVEEMSNMAYLIEGLTSISDLFLNHISINDQGIGFKHSYQYQEDGYSFGGLQPGHYGLVQNELHRAHVFGFNTLPIRFLIYTALIIKGENKRNNKTVYGPKVAGNALTYVAPSWFNETIHLEEVEQEDGDVIKKYRAAWFQDHSDKDTEISYICKSRVIPELMPKLIARCGGNSYVKLGYKRGIEKYFSICSELTDEWKQGRKQLVQG